MARVLQLIETAGPGGAEIMVMRLAEHLVRRGHELLVGLLKEGWLSEKVRKAGLEVQVLPLGRTPDFSWICEACTLVRRRRIDVIHAHEFAMNSYGSLVSALTNISAIATVHGKNYYAGRSHRRAAYRLVARHAQMVAVSQDIRAFLEDAAGVPRRLVRVIHNGVDTTVFRPDRAARARVRAELGLGPEALIVGSVGSLYPVKGHACLIEAIARLRPAYPNAVLLVVGRGSEEEKLRALARQCGIERTVRFLGLREDVRELLAAMDVFALPSLSEGTPLSVLEAMAAELPVVATAVGGLPEVVRDKETGYLVPSGNVPAMADALCHLLGNPDLRLKAGRRARRHVEANFSIEGAVAAYEALYAR